MINFLKNLFVLQKLALNYLAVFEFDHIGMDEQDDQKIPHP